MIQLQLAIDYLVIGIVTLSGVLIYFALFLIYKRSREVVSQRRRERYISKKQMDWFDYFYHDQTFSVTLIPRNHDEIKGAEEIFLAYIKNLSDPSIHEKIRSFANQYLVQYYSNNLKRKNWSIKMNTLYHIAQFQMDRILHECQRLEHEKMSKDEYFQLLKIYSLFHVDIFINKIIFSPVSLTLYDYKKLLASNRNHTTVMNRLIDQFDHLPKVLQYAVLDIVGINRTIDDLPFLETNFKKDDAEIRIRSLKAINDIGVISNLNQYLPFVESPIWEERLMIAKILGYLPLSVTLPYLQRLLEDDSWWVRSQAAKTIGHYKSGKERLQEFIKTTNDKYAIEMAYEVIKEGV